MDIERNFEDLGVDAITGVKLMNLLGLNQYDFADPARFMRFKDIIDYFKGVPDMEYLINKITIGKNVDKVDHVWGYAELSKQKRSLRSEVDEIMNKIDTVSSLGDEMHTEMVKGLQERLVDRQQQTKQVAEQISKYEY